MSNQVNTGAQMNIHFLGIGGIGMSAIAQYLFEKGYNISGSDSNSNSDMVKNLREKGIEIIPEDNLAAIIDNDYFIKTSAIKDDNEIITHIKDSGKICIKRAQALAEIAQQGKQLAIAGTHGKTTTSSMLSYILNEIDYEPTAFIGGIMSNYKQNFLVGKNKYFVLEADEYDRSFLKLNPFILGITNIEIDHLDIYCDLFDIVSTFEQLISKTSFLGKIFINADDLNSGKLDIRKHFFTYGIESEADYRAYDIDFVDLSSTFKVSFKNKFIGEFTLNMPGIHNVYNALLAISIALSLGIDSSKIAQVLTNFKGIKRRFEFIAQIGNTKIYDDYAHHPSEVRSAISSLVNKKKSLVVFQPHLYSRTKDFYQQFASELAEAENIVLLPIFPAREKKIPQVSSKLIYEEMKKSNKNVILIEDKIEAKLKNIILNYEVVLHLGAGDIYKIFEQVIFSLKMDKINAKKYLKPLKTISHIRIGKKAKYCYVPQTIEQVKEIYREFSELKKIIPIGNASNLLFSDEINSILVLDKDLKNEFLIKDKTAIISANYNINEVINQLNKSDLCGLEFLIGVPAHIGGLIYMNAGAYGNYISDFLQWIDIVNQNGDLIRLDKKDIHFGYRSTNIDGFIVRACFNLNNCKSKDFFTLKKFYLEKRKLSQPLTEHNIGCFFKNIPNNPVGKLIDEIGLKGYQIGNAQVSLKHANFLVNKANATFSDMKKLIQYVKKEVKEKYNYNLELEIKVIE